MHKSITPKHLKDHQSTSSKNRDKLNEFEKPSLSVVKYLMAYSSALEVVEGKQYGQYSVFLN